MQIFTSYLFILRVHGFRGTCGTAYLCTASGQMGKLILDMCMKNSAHLVNSDTINQVRKLDLCQTAMHSLELKFKCGTEADTFP